MLPVFLSQERNRRFQCVVLSYADTYFLQGHSDAPQKYSGVKTLDCLSEHNFVEFGHYENTPIQIYRKFHH